MKALNYNEFAKECVQELKLLQERFRVEYDVNSYENWFYNEATGILTFSTGEEELNFEYFTVGSFSKRSNTWNWSWDNSHTFDKVKEKSKLVKGFGETHHFSKLTDGLFESDEFEAWEFAAITAKLTNSIGVYRPVNDESLQLFLVITKVIDNETAKSVKSRYVECGAHEYRRRAFVCQHLNYSQKVGFEEAFETFEGMKLLEDDDFQAWCNKCGRVRRKEKGWNDKSMEFAQIKLICEDCYFEIKELNLGYR